MVRNFQTLLFGGEKKQEKSRLLSVWLEPAKVSLQDHRVIQAGMDFWRSVTPTPA